MEKEGQVIGESEREREIVFMDVETTIPRRAGEGYALLEFGAVILCGQKLVEVGSFSTLIRPSDISMISPASVRCNGITPESLSSAPPFPIVADKIFNILHGRVWAGHNITRFDCLRIREAFEKIGRPAPEPKGLIDSLPLLTQTFGRRAGDMKMATLASYFGLGHQKHRSIEDVRMNFEVLKYCATVLLLESSFPDIFTSKSGISPTITTRNHVDRCGDASLQVTHPNLMSSSDVGVDNNQNASTSMNNNAAQVTTNMVKPDSVVREPDPSGLLSAIDQMKIDTLLPDATMDDRHVPNSVEVLPPPTEDTSFEHCSSYAGFCDPSEVLTSSISVSLVQGYQGSSKIVILHKNVLLQLCCMNLRVRFGVSAKFLDHAGRPKLSIVLDAPASLCRVLDTCDNLAQKLSLDSGSSSEWRPVVMRRNHFLNFSTIRLHIPTVENGNTATYSTEMLQKEPSGNVQKLVFSRIDAAELDSLFVSGTILDAYFSVDSYDYQQHAGIRLVARRLVLHPKQND